MIYGNALKVDSQVDQSERFNPEATAGTCWYLLAQECWRNRPYGPERG
jgi:hypothetical protein